MPVRRAPPALRRRASPLLAPGRLCATAGAPAPLRHGLRGEVQPSIPRRAGHLWVGRIANWNSSRLRSGCRRSHYDPGAAALSEAAVAARYGFPAQLTAGCGQAPVPRVAAEPQPGPAELAVGENRTGAGFRKDHRRAVPPGPDWRARQSRRRSDASGVRLFYPPPSVLPTSPAGGF